ncbi:MAG: MerR family DNA-binding transcriptional regulator [Candidatus Thiocaldithrix dubininis]|uniref:MerR family DNA-binding transcriptional regulator n=1 Tax=Candidatus Thiocaldithrix dubininis TaxID=3080823 RepID=A0AA95KIX0_9GAMM|nr:MAG: MerR family DNA-binding transcriptional regulator [Candidatus Thiocaldithrix dubininis]
MQHKLWTISELADELNVTTRTIRFYEDKDLLRPQRLGANRVFNYQDRARLHLILRGKRLGFSLEEIKEFIELYKTEVNPNQTEQIDYLLQRVRAKVATLRQQQQDLAMTIDELNHIETLCLAELDGIKRT